MGVSPKTYTLLGASIFFFVFWTGFWFVHLMAIFHGRFKFHRKPVNLVRETPLPGVSILKPLLGVDQNLFGNLETFFTLDYPIYELLFCIKDESDPVIMLVNSLIEKYPHVDAKVFIGGEKVGVNPKINNMQPGYKAAKYELVMISDSGIRMKEDTLLDMVDHMTDSVGLVHQMPFVCDREGFPSVLEKVYFGTAHARIYLAADLVRSNCCTGMSTLMRKSILETEGGIQAFGCYLAEDYFFAKAVLNQGYRLRVSSQPAWQNSGVCDIDQFKARTTRWAQLRIAMIPILMVVEPLSECLVLGLNAAWATSYLFNWDPIAFYLTHVLIWFLLDWTLLCIVQKGPLPFKNFEFGVGWLLREVSAPLLFLSAIISPDVQWRSGSYRLKWGGHVEEVKSSN